MEKKSLGMGWACLLATSLGAQSLVLPAYHMHEEGNQSSKQPFFGSAGQVYQQVHDALRGAPRTIAGLAFRQDGSRTSQHGQHPWWSEFEVRLVGGVYPGATTTLANNYRTTPTRVFQNRRLQVPDWSALPAQGPTPFTLQVPFDQPYSHDGAHALLFEFRTVADSGPEVAVCGADAFEGAPPRRWQAESAGGFGCTNQQTLDIMRLDAVAELAAGAQVAVTFTAHGWVPATPGATLLGIEEVDLGLGLCAPLRVVPLLALPSLPQAGTLVTSLLLPYDAALAGPRFRAQAVVPDPQLGGGYLPFRLSYPVLLRLPRESSAQDAAVLRVRYEAWPSQGYVVEAAQGLVVRFE